MARASAAAFSREAEESSTCPPSTSTGRFARASRAAALRTSPLSGAGGGIVRAGEAATRSAPANSLAAWRRR